MLLGFPQGGQCKPQEAPLILLQHTLAPQNRCFTQGSANFWAPHRGPNLSPRRLSSFCFSTPWHLKIAAFPLEVHAFGFPIEGPS